MNTTPNSERLHIGFFGRRNAGKSTLFNFLLGQELSIVSDVLGTTTDPVKKAMEVPGIGPCLLIDTAGIDDEKGVGLLRTEKTYQMVRQTDLAVFVFAKADEPSKKERELIEDFRRRKVPCIFLLNKRLIEDEENRSFGKMRLEAYLNEEVYIVDRLDDQMKKNLIERISKKVPNDFFAKKLFEDYDLYGKTVIAVMPQDKQAPKGRLIFPQVSSIREILDKAGNVFCCVPEHFSSVFHSLKEPPYLVLTDATALKDIKAFIPKEIPVTSFSAVFAAYKGDADIYRKGAESIDLLKDGDRVLISELCTHEPIEGDIGRVKIPRMLADRLKVKLEFDICSGADFPTNLSKYSLIIQCGACMANRRAVMNRIRQAVFESVPITNYGILIARLQGMDGSTGRA